MGYNFGCMIASDTLFDSRGGFSGARNPRVSCSHYDVILIMTSFATELATPSVTDERTLLTLYRV